MLATQTIRMLGCLPPLPASRLDSKGTRQRASWTGQVQPCLPNPVKFSRLPVKESKPSCCQRQSHARHAIVILGQNRSRSTSCSARQKKQAGGAKNKLSSRQSEHTASKQHLPAEKRPTSPRHAPQQNVSPKRLNRYLSVALGHDCKNRFSWLDQNEGDRWEEPGERSARQMSKQGSQSSPTWRQDGGSRLRATSEPGRGRDDVELRMSSTLKGLDVCEKVQHDACRDQSEGHCITNFNNTMRRRCKSPASAHKRREARPLGEFEGISSEEGCNLPQISPASRRTCGISADVPELSEDELVSCPHCHHTFLPSRLEVHIRSCSRASIKNFCKNNCKSLPTLQKKAWQERIYP